MLQQIDVQVTLRHAYDAYREDMAATLIEWISDICECHVAGDPDLTTNVLAAVLQETRTTDSQVAPDLQLAEHGVYEYPDGSRGREPHRESLPGRQTTAPTTLRLDWLWLTDNRLWKRPKLQMRAIYSRVMYIHPSCLEFASELNSWVSG
jgi:E3 ubiquitin-protein ligase UBR1